jgi:hypothetical protein
MAVPQAFVEDVVPSSQLSSGPCQYFNGNQRIMKEDTTSSQKRARKKGGHSSIEFKDETTYSKSKWLIKI